MDVVSAKVRNSNSMLAGKVIVSSVLAAALFVGMPKTGKSETPTPGFLASFGIKAVSFTPSNSRLTHWSMS